MLFRLSVFSLMVSSLPYLSFFKGQVLFYIIAGFFISGVFLKGISEGVFPSRQNLPLLLYLTWLPLSYLLSGSSQGSFALKTAGYFVGAYSSVIIMGRILAGGKGIKFLANFLSLFSASGLILFVLDLMGIRNFGIMYGMRIPYIGVHPIRSLAFGPNYFSILALMGFAVSFFLFVSGRKVYLVHLLVNLLGIFLSFSRAGYLALVVFVLVWFWEKRGFKALLLLLPVLVSASVLPAFLQLSKGMTGREVIWPLAWELILEFPVSGWGMGVEDVFSRTGIKWGSAHNSFLDVGLMYGLVGMLLYTLLFLFTMALVRRKDRKSREFLFPLLCSLFVLSAFTTFVVGGFSIGSQLAGVFLGMGMRE